VKRGRAPGHERFLVEGHHTGRLTYSLRTLKPVHVSSGIYALTEDVKRDKGGVIRDHYRVTNAYGERQPAVPGSSLKGAARAVVEAVTCSCVVVTRVDRAKLPRESRACGPEALCPACALFGAQSRFGRVSFSDAVMRLAEMSVRRVAALYGPRPWQARRTYLDAHGNFLGRKFYFHGRPMDDPAGQQIEVIPEGRQLDGSLDFHSLTAAELGLLFFALGLDGSFRPMLGGGKPLALGAVEYRPLSIDMVTAASWTDYEAGDARLEMEALDSFIRDRLADAQALILPKQRDRLRAILNPANTREAPRGVY
jgi:hypothetical protein